MDAGANSHAAVVCGDLNLLRCLVGLDIPTMVLTWNPEEVTLKSRFCRNKRVIAPPTDETNALRDLEEVGRAFPQRPVLYYGTDDLLLLLSRNRERLSSYYLFRLPPADLVECLVDKNRFCDLARDNDILVPKTITVVPGVEFADIADALVFPAVFKPNTHIGWMKDQSAGGGKPRKALRANTPDEAEHLFRIVSRRSPSFVIQRCIEGGEDQIYSYHAYVDGLGCSLGEFVGKKIRTYPMEAGVSTYLELVKAPDIIELGREIIAKLGLSGPMKLDFKKDPNDGRYYLLEINPRFTLWNYLGAACGVNLPELAYADLMGELRQNVREYRTGVRWLSFGNDFRAFVRDYRATGTLSWAEWLGSYVSPKVYDVFAWNDPAPFAACVANYARAVSRRLMPPVERAH